jgi:hypothetical protein
MLQTLAITGPIYLVIALDSLPRLLEDRHTRAGRGRGQVRATEADSYGAVPAAGERHLNGRYVLDHAVGLLAVMLFAFAWGSWREGKSAYHKVQHANAMGKRR